MESQTLSLSHRPVVEYNNRTDTPLKPVNDENLGLAFPPIQSISTKYSHILCEESDHLGLQINGSGDQRTEVMPNTVPLNGSVDENHLRRAVWRNTTTDVCPPTLTPNDLNRVTTYSSMSTNSSTNNCELIIGNVFLNHLRQSFNNPNNCDLRIRSEDNVIYCHKTILEIRNDAFWQILRQKLVQNSDEIYINPDSFTAFYAFIQYIYGLRPQFDDQNVKEVQNWANIFKEQELEELCEQHITRMQNIPNSGNVCALYEKAVTQGLKELEISCIEFAAINWKSIIKSNGFQDMSESLSKRLMLSIIGN